MSGQTPLVLLGAGGEMLMVEIGATDVIAREVAVVVRVMGTKLVVRKVEMVVLLPIVWVWVTGHIVVEIVVYTVVTRGAATAVVDRVVDTAIVLGVDTGMVVVIREVEMTVELAGQLTTPAAQEMIVLEAVITTVETLCAVVTDLDVVSKVVARIVDFVVDAVVNAVVDALVKAKADVLVAGGGGGNVVVDVQEAYETLDTPNPQELPPPLCLNTTAVASPHWLFLTVVPCFEQRAN